MSRSKKREVEVLLFSYILCSEMPEAAKVHVGNLPFRIENDDLLRAFEKYGVVEEGRLSSS